MLSCRQLLILFVSIQTIFSLGNHTTITYNSGRIENIADEYIYTIDSSSTTVCMHACVQFPLQHSEYPTEDCYAYNYNSKTSTCELIHSTEPLEYIINFDTRWKTGIKSYT